MASLLISDLNVLEDVSHEEMTRLEGGAAAASAAAATNEGATSASAGGTNSAYASGYVYPSYSSYGYYQGPTPNSYANGY